MQVARWGEDLVVRLPEELVESLALQEGDEVEMSLQLKKTGSEITETMRIAALNRIRELRRPLPEGFKFDREELHERRGLDLDESR